MTHWLPSPGHAEFAQRLDPFRQCAGEFPGCLLSHYFASTSGALECRELTAWTLPPSGLRLLPCQSYHSTVCRPVEITPDLHRARFSGLRTLLVSAGRQGLTVLEHSRFAYHTRPPLPSQRSHDVQLGAIPIAPRTSQIQRSPVRLPWSEQAGPGKVGRPKRSLESRVCMYVANLCYCPPESLVRGYLDETKPQDLIFPIPLLPCPFHPAASGMRPPDMAYTSRRCRGSRGSYVIVDCRGATYKPSTHMISICLRAFDITTPSRKPQAPR